MKQADRYFLKDTVLPVFMEQVLKMQQAARDFRNTPAQLLFSDQYTRANDIMAELEAEDSESKVDSEACPGCGCVPGDGVTATCSHPEGCGFWKSEQEQHELLEEAAFEAHIREMALAHLKEGDADYEDIYRHILDRMEEGPNAVERVNVAHALTQLIANGEVVIVEDGNYRA